MNTPSALLLTTTMATAALVAQTEPSFEVASVRPSQGFISGQTMRTTPGTLTVEGFTMSQLLRWAYGVQEFQIQAGPDWFRDTRFTIAAKAADAADDDRLRLMLRTLLGQRFGLKLHHELKDLPTFKLTLAKGGPRFHDSSTKDASKFLESTTTGDPRFSKDRTGLFAERVTMAELAGQLADPLKRPVVDKTGLKGRYDFRIDITAYINPGGEDGGQPQVDPIALIFNAFQGQLGLKVEAGKDQVELLVIDAVNRVPTEN